MTPEPEATFHVVDKRRFQTSDQPASNPPVSANCRRHAVLLGFLGADHARDFLDGKGLESELLAQAMQQGERAETHIKGLPKLQESKTAAQPIRHAVALSEIQRVMSRPECKSAYPEGSWSAELVEIAGIIPLQPSLDLDYAQSFNGPDLAPSQMLPAVKLSFAEKHPSEFDVTADQLQKAISISGLNPSLEVVGLRYESQPDGGPVLVSFVVSPAPNIVVVSRYAGRHFLSSGYHRVFRLMKVGYSHVPCVVREVKTLAQVGARGSEAFRDPVFMSPRPPLFPDFADPVLATIVPFPALRRVIRIRPDEYFVPA